ncbi:MAG: MFS transporter [Thermoleophilia bacterium]
MRRLLAFVAAVVFVETMFFAALGPLLPELKDALSISEWQAGILTAAYAIGGVLGALPAGMLTMRIGMRRTAIAGLLLLAAGSVLFAFVDGYWPLVLARGLQGIGAAASWTGALAWLVQEAPRERRGELIGFALGAAIAGALMGPALGWAASAGGRTGVFIGVAAVAATLAAIATREREPERGERQPLRRLWTVRRDPRVLTGVWLLSLPALLHGALTLIGPLRFDDLGWAAFGIAMTFIVSAVIEASVNPLVGRWSDRAGRLAPMRVGLVAAAVVCVLVPVVGNPWALAVVVIAAGVSLSAFWTPAMAMLVDGTEGAGLHHGLGFAVMNMAWAPGNILGTAVGGALADLAGNGLPFGLCAALCILSLLGIRRWLSPARGPALGPSAPAEQPAATRG